MNNGIVVALVAYATFSWSDAAIKALGGGLSVFEIGFFLTLVSGTVIFIAKPGEERWRDFWKMKRPWLVQARALCGLVASILSVVTFTSISLAEAYALIFLAPICVTILSVVALREHVGPWRWAAVVAGFVGVLLAVKPGFRELGLGHLAAFGIAFLAAVIIVLMRSLAASEAKSTILGFFILYGLAGNAIGIAATSFTPPTWEQAGILLIAGVFSACGNIGLLRATHLAPANQIAPTMYSQIAWAVVLGFLFFSEKPDLLTLVGLAVIAGSGLLTLDRERIRLGSVRWNPFSRDRI